MSIFRCVVILFTAFLTFAQTASREFHLTTVPSASGLREIATIIHTVGNIQQVFVDVAKFDITVSGTDAELSLAAWLIKQLDSTTPMPAQYTVPDGGDVVNIVYLANSSNQADINELVTSVRTVAGVQRIFTYSPPRAIVFRTTPSQALLAGWLVPQLDVSPADQARFQPHEYQIPSNPTQLVKVDYLIHPVVQRSLNEMVTTIRTVADIQAIFTRSAPQGIAFRGSLAQAQLGDWLLQQLDVQPDDQMRAAKHEYVMPDVTDGVTRVYYLRTDDTNHVAQAIRSEAGIRRIFICSETKALALRGTVDEMQIADHVIKEHDQLAAR